VAAILGPGFLSITSKKALSLSATAALSPCAVSHGLNFSWALYNSSGQLQAIKSASADPKSYVLPPYSLTAGSSYKLALTVTALSSTGHASSAYDETDIFIMHGTIVAAVRGGYHRQCPVDAALFLDAAISYDEDNQLGNAVLTYAWSCYISSINNFGSSCGFPAVRLNTSSLHLPAFTMELSTTYSFVVVVSSADGRSDSQTVIVVSQLSGAPSVYSSNTRYNFNQNQKLVIPGTVTANVSTICSWTAFTSNIQLSVGNALTPLTRSFLKEESSMGIAFPLAVPPDTFSFGRLYTFRLSCTPQAYPALLAYTDVFLAVNSPPIGGYTAVVPSKGYGLLTSFAMSTTGWTDDIADYPLQYNFAYQLSPLKGALTLSVISPLPYTVSPLPTGLKSQGSIVSVFAMVYDVFGASANVSTAVIIVADSNEDPSAYLSIYLLKSIQSGDLDLTFQTINLVSSTLSAVNCSAAPLCADLHRASCYATVNTCSSCLTGYRGVVGDANAMCFEESDVHGTIGATCATHTDCLYDLCSNGICAAPSKTCQSNSPGTVCSGNGVCLSSDSSRNIVKQCPITSPYCTASCTCEAGYGGVDCSLSAAQLSKRSNARVSMCTALQTVVFKSAKSASLFGSVVSALESAYDFTEILDLHGLVACSKVLRFLSILAERGFLSGTDAVTQQTYAEIISQFVETNVHSSVGTSTLTSLLGQFRAEVAGAVDSLTSGALKGMVAGQRPVSIVTSNVRATVQHELVSLLSSASLSPPPTLADSIYGARQPKIFIPRNGIAACGSGDGYAQLSTLLYGTNPHAKSNAQKSALLQFSSTVTKKTVKTKILGKALTDQISNTNTNHPAYYVTLQFSSVQNLNLTIQSKPFNKDRNNVTLPQCSLYDYTKSKFVTCSNCNISSYTDYNVTFGCRSIHSLCPIRYTSRRLEALEGPCGSLFPIGETEGEGETGTEDAEGMGCRSLKARAGHNHAATDDDYVSSADDGPAPDDDEFSSTDAASATEFGSTLAAVGSNLASVLSLNPFAIDIKQATPILAFVSCLTGLLFLGVIFFMKWDKKERHQSVYLHDAKVRAMREKINDNLTRGGCGLWFDERGTARLKRQSISGSVMRRLSVLLPLSKGQCKEENICEKSPSHSTPTSCLERSSEGNVDKDLLPSVLIAEFSNRMIPVSYAINENSLQHKRGTYFMEDNTWTNALRTLRKTHYVSQMFFGASIKNSRTLRFLEMSRVILLGVFIDTLFFGIYFPSDATCAVNTSRVDCEAEPSKVVAGSSLCKWQDASCSIQPPPASVLFTLMASFIIIIFIIPLDFFVGYIQEEYAAKRPELEKWGLDTVSWLGAVHVEQDVSKAPLTAALMMQGELHGGEHEGEGEGEGVELGIDEINILSHKAYESFSSPREELQILTDKVMVR
jgi:REJ domain